MPRKKIALIGGGQIGGVLAQLSALRELGDVVLFDVCPKGANSYEEIAGANIVIITAGLPRKPGMSRDDLIAINSKIMTSVAEGIKKHAPDAFIICISNPMDVMVTLCQKVTGFPKNRVMGMAGVQDSSCFAAFIAWELGVSVKDVTAMVMGGHGADMVPLIRYASMFGIPVMALLEKIYKNAAKAKEVIDAMVNLAANAGGEVVGLLKTGSAFYSLASSAICMAEAILRDQKRFLPVCALLEGEYGVNGYYVGVPCMLGKNGIEKIIEFDLNSEEQVLFNKSVFHVKALVDSLKQCNVAYS